jgi:hypothetical protein
MAPARSATPTATASSSRRREAMTETTVRVVPIGPEREGIVENGIPLRASLVWSPNASELATFGRGELAAEGGWR